MLKHIRTTIRELMDAAYASREIFREISHPMQEPPHKLERYQIREPGYWTTTHYLKLGERADWTGAPDPLRMVIARAVERMRKAGFPVYVHTVWRSPAEQQRKYEEGYSKLISGPHNRSAAADVVHAHYHWNCNERFWTFWGIVVKDAARQEGVQINWGGDWRFYDPAHVELADWKDRQNVHEHDRKETHMPRSLLTGFGISKPTNEEMNALIESFNNA